MVTRLALIALSGLSVLFVGHIPANPARAGLPDLARTTGAGRSFSVPAVAHGGPIRYYLSSDRRLSRSDVLLAAAGSRVAVPPIARGAYHLLSCSGAHCVASRNLVTVRAKGGS
jgi:hypothetical protein